LADKTLKDDLARKSIDDNDAYDDSDNMSFGHDDFDFARRDDGALTVNILPKKRKGNGFADVAGMAPLKQLLKRNFIDIIRHRDKAKKYNIQPSNGILLYGPPGCGKTFIAEKIAEEANLNFVMVKPSDLGSTYIHGTQTKIADLFKKAEEKAPSILCFDEFDTLVPARTEETNHNVLTEVNEFLVQLNNCASRGVYVLAMTNNINLIDKAILRKGRIDEVIYVPEPDAEARCEMFKCNLSKTEMTADDIDLQRLAELTKGYSSSDIAYIVLEASREAFRVAIASDDWVKITQEDLEAVIKRTSPSFTSSDLQHYENMRDEFVTKKKQIEIRPRIGFAV
jgi:transitional endoplasmic reticulum ATPase